MNQEEQAKKVQKISTKAWADETFKQRLISNPSETLREEGSETPPDKKSGRREHRYDRLPGAAAEAVV